MTTITTMQQVAGRGWPSCRSWPSTAIGIEPLGAQSTVGVARLPTDPLGSMQLTLTNVVVGSRYRVERQAGGALATPTGNATGVAASSTVVLTLDYFSAGSANNDVRIKVRGGSAITPRRKDFETLATLGEADQSVFIAQALDE